MRTVETYLNASGVMNETLLLRTMKHKLYVMGKTYDGKDAGWMKVGEYDSWRRLDQAHSDLKNQKCYKNRSWKMTTGDIR